MPEKQDHQVHHLAQESYDGYYEDVLPPDYGKLKFGINWKLVYHAAIVCASALSIIGFCLILLFLF